jgi:hypothetical protein
MLCNISYIFLFLKILCDNFLIMIFVFKPVFVIGAFLDAYYESRLSFFTGININHILENVILTKSYHIQRIKIK